MIETCGEDIINLENSPPSVNEGLQCKEKIDNGLERG